MTEPVYFDPKEFEDVISFMKIIPRNNFFEKEVAKKDFLYPLIDKFHSHLFGGTNNNEKLFVMNDDIEKIIRSIQEYINSEQKHTLSRDVIFDSFRLLFFILLESAFYFEDEKYSVIKFYYSCFRKFEDNYEEIRRRGRVSTEEEEDNQNTSEMIMKFHYMERPKYIYQYIFGVSEVRSLIAKNIDDWNKKSETIENRIRKALDESNFLGLHKGFSEVLNNKKKSLDNKAETVTGIPWLIIGIIILYISFVGFEIFCRNGFSWEQQAQISLPVFSLILLALYFYRVKYSEYQSEKAVVLQLEQRCAIIQFIQNYAEFKTKHGASKDYDPLEKFEALIFGGITPEAKDIPTAFDGASQLSELIKALKK